MGAGSGAGGRGERRPPRLDPEWVQVCEWVGEDLKLHSRGGSEGWGQAGFAPLHARREFWGGRERGRDEASEAGLALKERVRRRLDPAAGLPPASDSPRGSVEWAGLLGSGPRWGAGWAVPLVPTWGHLLCGRLDRESGRCRSGAECPRGPDSLVWGAGGGV